MMIVNLCVDERLVHGQVVTNWLKFLGVNHVVVANDRAAKDEIQKMSLSMAVPSSIKCLIVDVDTAIKVLSDPRSKDKKMMVICGNLTDVIRITDKVKDIEEINIANYGNLTDGSLDRKVVNKTLRCNEEEMQCIREIVKTGFPVINQPLPANSKKSLKSL